jgi:rhodanese-related sulfurtransferase
MMRKITSLLIMTLCLFSFTSVFASNDEFPGRKKFPKVPTMELSELTKDYNDVAIVDARATMEYDTISIKGAINIPVAKKDFQDKVRQLRSKTKKPIVFYCNGHTCMKSYQATKKAMEAGVKNVYAMDAGVFEWTKANPKLAILLGQSPVNLSHLITKKDFHKHFLDPDTFSDKATAVANRTMILDIRDKFQRAGVGFYPGKEHWASLDQRSKVRKYIKKAIAQNRTLMIYDEVGKQVEWLQYELEKAGARNYYFMDKGARGYFAAMNSWGNNK